MAVGSTSANLYGWAAQQQRRINITPFGSCRGKTRNLELVPFLTAFAVPHTRSSTTGNIVHLS